MLKGDSVRPFTLSGLSSQDCNIVAKVMVNGMELDPDLNSACVQALDNEHLDCFALGFQAYLFESPEIPSKISDYLNRYNIPYVTSITKLDTLRSKDILEITNHIVRVLFRADSGDNALFIENKCNCNCLICPMPLAARQAAEPSVAKILKLISLIDRNTKHLAITGGEPTLLRENLFLILNACRSNLPHTSFTLLTNARMFSNETYLQDFSSSKPEHMLIGVPLYGATSDIHDLITDTSGSFEQTISGLKNLLRINCRVEIRIVVNRLNYRELPDLADFISHNFSSVFRVNIMALEMLGNALKNQEQVWVNFEEVTEYVALAARKLLVHGIKTYLYNFPLCFIDQELWSINVKSISDYKVRFFDNCQTCLVKEKCGGFFYSTIRMKALLAKPFVQTAPYGKNYFNFKPFGDRVLATNDSGKYVFLDNESFYKLTHNQISTTDPTYEILSQKGFICNSPKEYSIDTISSRVRKLKNYLFDGTQLHIFVLTNECNQHCIYCQASANKKSSPMSYDVAKKSVDLAFQSPSRYLSFEFQGGEPLLNFAVLKSIVEYTKDVNSQKHHKAVNFSITTNLIALTSEMIDFFQQNKISVSTSIDGPEHLQHQNRPSAITDYYKIITQNIDLLRRNKISVQGIQTTTRYSLNYPREIVDEYVALGFRTIFLRPLSPIGYAKTNWPNIGYAPEDYIEFYLSALNYIIDLNNQGIKICESYILLILRRILQQDPLNYMELRSPCGGSIGQLAYNYNGQIYTCDEGRMLGEMGDDSFLLGNVSNLTYREIIESPVTKTLCVSSCLEALPYCESCVYQPYCGICPIINYAQEGNVFSQMPLNFRCKVNKAIFEFVFSVIKNKDEKILSIFRNWLFF